MSAAAAVSALKADGFRVWEPPSEADAQLAYLARTGIVEYVLSEDSDMLALGVPPEQIRGISFTRAAT